MDEIEKRHFEDATQALEGAERELIAAMQNFIDAQAKAGKSKGHALDILRQLLRKAREEKAKRYRAAFKIVGPNTFRPENFLPFASNSAESEHRENDLAGRDPPAGISADDAMAEIQDVLDSIGDTCAECPSED